MKKAFIFLTLILLSCFPEHKYVPLCGVVWQAECRYGVCRVEFATKRKEVIQGDVNPGETWCIDYSTRNSEWYKKQ